MDCNATTLPMCPITQCCPSDAAADECGDLPPCNTHSPIPTNAPIPTQMMQCLLNPELCAQTPLPSFTAQCCVPGIIECRPGMPICNDCCDPNLFNCPVDAPLCANRTHLPSQSSMPAVRASQNPTQRPTLLPEATKYVRLRVSARSTPWAVRPTVLPSPLPVIQSKLEFRGANASAFSRPEKIQEVVTTLGCTLRLALEQIVIKNITWVSVDGRRTVLSFDPSVAALRSNGSTDCFVADTTVPNARRLQANSDSGRVEIDYAITDPPASITALDSGSFSAIVENSPSLQNLAASVGSSGLSAPAPAELTTEPAVQTTQSSSFMNLPVYGIVLVAIGSSIFVGGLIYSVMRSFRAHSTPVTKTPQAIVSEGRVVQVVYLQNPLESKMNPGQSRRDFVPMKVIGAKRG